jgi:hypothetical protein
VGGGFEPQVALAAATTGGCHECLIGFAEILEYFAGLGIADDGARRHLKDQVFATAAGFLFSLAVGAASGFEMAFIAKRQEGPASGSAFQYDIAALTPVPPVGPPPGDKFFAAKTDATATAIAGLDGNGCFIDKFHSA